MSCTICFSYVWDYDDKNIVSHTDLFTRYALLFDVGIGIIIGYMIFKKGESEKNMRAKNESEEIDYYITPMIKTLKYYEQIKKDNPNPTYNDLEKYVKNIKTDIENVNSEIDKKINYSRGIIEPTYLRSLRNILILNKKLLFTLHLDSECESRHEILKNAWIEFDKLFIMNSKSIEYEINHLTDKLKKRYKYTKMDLEQLN